MLVLAVVSGWAGVLPNLMASIAVFCVMVLLSRRRRWRDRKFLSKAAVLPDNYIKSQPKTVRDMEIGEEGYIDGSAVVTSKRRHRVFVDWSASLRPQPEKPRDILAFEGAEAETRIFNYRTARRSVPNRFYPVGLVCAGDRDSTSRCTGQTAARRGFEVGRDGTQGF